MKIDYRRRLHDHLFAPDVSDYVVNGIRKIPNAEMTGVPEQIENLQEAFGRLVETLAVNGKLTAKDVSEIAGRYSDEDVEFDDT